MTLQEIHGIMGMAGCSSKCKESGCDDKAEKNGYCQTHWALHELEKLFS